MGFDVDKVKYAARSDRLRRVMVNLAATAIKKSTKTVEDELGLNEPLDTDSPAIRAILRDMASRIVNIEETTRERVRGYVEFGNEHGLSIDELAKAIRQDASGAFGESRARTIARTESAVLYSQTSAAGWRDSGLVEQVWIFDGDGCGWTEHNDPDEADGSIRTLDEFEETPISHPNCLRSAAPYQGDALDGIRDAGTGQGDD